MLSVWQKTIDWPAMAEEGAVPVIVTLIEWFLATVVWNNHDAGMDKERINSLCAGFFNRIRKDWILFWYNFRDPTNMIRNWDWRVERLLESFQNSCTLSACHTLTWVYQFTRKLSLYYALFVSGVQPRPCAFRSSANENPKFMCNFCRVHVGLWIMVMGMECCNCIICTAIRVVSLPGCCSRASEEHWARDITYEHG